MKKKKTPSKIPRPIVWSRTQKRLSRRTDEQQPSEADKDRTDHSAPVTQPGLSLQPQSCPVIQSPSRARPGDRDYTTPSSFTSSIIEDQVQKKVLRWHYGWDLEFHCCHRKYAMVRNEVDTALHGHLSLVSTFIIILINYTFTIMMSFTRILAIPGGQCIDITAAAARRQ